MRPRFDRCLAAAGLALVAGGAAGPPEPAVAREAVPIADVSPWTRIALAGPRTAWTDPLNHNRWLLRLAHPGSSADPERLVTTAPSGPHVVSLELAGSSRALAVSEHVEPYDPFDRDPDDDTESVRILAGLDGAAPVEVARLCPRRDAGRVAADGSRIAYLMRCHGAPTVIAIRDLQSGASADVRVEGDAAPRQLRLAGDRVAWLEVAAGAAEPHATVTVLDLLTDERRVAWRGTDAAGIDLRADGAVAVVAAAAPGAPAELTVVAADGTARRLPDAVAGPVLFSGREHVVVERVADGAPGGRVLALAGLDGHVREIARFLPAGSGSALRSWDVEGSRLAWVEGSCPDEATIWQVDLDTLDRPVDPRPARLCRNLGVQTTQAVVDRRGRLTLELWCPTGCRGRVRVGHYVDEPKARARFDLPPSTEPQDVALRFGRLPPRLRRGKAIEMRGRLVSDVRDGIWDLYDFELTLLPPR